MSFKYTPDDIEIHKPGTLRIIAGEFASHENGLPEWVKNSATAYVRAGTPQDKSVVVLVFQDAKGRIPASISCLDFVGMTPEDIDQFFRRWGDPDAAGRGLHRPDILGGHGNGGKSYMTMMFEDFAYLHTVREGKGSRYGVQAGEFTFGYAPNRKEGRGFPVSDMTDELDKALDEMGMTHKDLPTEARRALGQRGGFTLVRGVHPKGYGRKIPADEILEAIAGHSQMIAALRLCQLYVVHNGKVALSGRQLALPEITPMEGASEPRVVPIPSSLTDPNTNRKVSTTDDGKLPAGDLILKTSDKSMRWKPRVYMHVIQCVTADGFVGTIEMRELSQSSYSDRMYGECRLDSLASHVRNDRTGLVESPLTRALKAWISRQVNAYAAEFEKRDRVRINQSERTALSQMNAALDRWKNQFLEELLSGSGGGEGPVTVVTRRLPSGKPAKIELQMSHSMAGVGVTFRPTLRFYDKDGRQIRPVEFQWVTDTNVAMVTDEALMLIESFSIGETDVYAETAVGKLRSNVAQLKVVGLRDIRIVPEKVELEAGSRSQLQAVCTLADGTQSSDIYLEWLEDNSKVANVSASGMVFGFSPGQTLVAAQDDRVSAAHTATVTVLPAAGKGNKPGSGKGYPQILLSEIDEDPESGEPARLSPRDAPVHQRPSDIQRNIWWINMRSPLARRYLAEAKGKGSESREWRVYHLERYIEALVKIQITHRQKQGEQMDLDQWLNLWDDTATKMQESAAQTLQAFLDDGLLPE